MTDDEQYMKTALQEAQKAFDKGEVPIGAVVVCNGTIVAKAHNLVETLHDATAHAEMLALTTAMDSLGSKYLEDCELYVTVEPCMMCAGALHWAHVKKIVYATADEKKGYSVFTKKPFFSKKTTVIKGILQEESQVLMQQFFKKLR